MAGHFALIMKNIFFLLIALPMFCFGQQPGFRKLYSGETTGATFVDIVWDGEKLITTGQFLTDTAPNNALNGLLYMELDTNGNPLFTDIYFHPNDAVTPQVGNSLYQSNKGFTYGMGQILNITSSYLSIYAESERVSTVEIPVDGLQSWLYHCVDWNENLLLAGRRSNYQYDSEGMLIKSDAMGNEIWRKFYGSPGLYCGIQEPYVIDDDNILLPGFKIHEGNGSITSSWGRSWMVLVDSLGNIKSQWDSPNHIENGASTRVLKMANGNWIYTSYEFIPMPGQIDDWGFRPKIICRDSNFNLVWFKYLSNFVSKTNRIIDITPTSDGNYLVVGKWLNYTMTSICKFSPSGDIIWSFNDPDAPVGFGDSFLGGVAELPSGSVVAAGYVEDYSTNKTEGLIIKLGRNGCMDTLCNTGWIGTAETEKVSKIKVFPNPAREVLTINNPIGERIEVFDMAGKLVRTVSAQGEKQPIPIHDLPPGAYIVRMQEKTLRVSYKIIKI
jgi:hypothetical protein